MSRDRVQTTVEFNYDNEKIDGTLFTYYHDNIEKSQTFMFNYKGNNIHISLEEEQNYWSVAPLHCKIIDKLGIDVHNKYEGYLSTIHSIERDYIIVDEEVYNYYSTLMAQSPKIYYVGLKLEDGTNLDGINKFTTIQDRQNKRNLFESLQSEVNYHFKEKNTKPDSGQLNIEKTKVYQETKKLIRAIYQLL